MPLIRPWVWMWSAGCAWITEAEYADRRDADGDGHDAAQWGGDDCDDRNAGVHPEATEVCNGTDDDCDGDVDDDDASLSGDVVVWRDDDGDRWGGTEIRACEPPDGTVDRPGDCDDAVGAVNPDATEVCNDLDDDCDDAIDEDAADALTWYADTDGDGFGSDEDAGVTTCDPPSGTVNDATDCDDGDADVHPGASEECSSGIDSNCDGLAGAADDDGDGSLSCIDCDDGNASVNPDADEVCNDVDDDCDTKIDDDDDDLTDASRTDWYADDDGDGYGDPAVVQRACDAPPGTVTDASDCDDTDATTHPDRIDVCNDGIDQDCSGPADDCDVSLAASDLVLRGSAFSDDLGTAIAGAGDADGDGFGDLVVGAPGAGSDAGVVYVVLGARAGDVEASAVAVAEIGGSASGDRVGACVAAVGDAGGSSDDDVAGCAAGDDAVFLLYGPPSSGTWTTADAVIRDSTTGDGFGAAIAGGDHDADSNGDLLVGSPDDGESLQPALGSVWLFEGPIAGSLTDGDAAANVDGSRSNGRLGRATALGDVDADGTDDWIVGGGTVVAALFDTGAVFVFDGPLSGAATDASADATISGSAAALDIGSTVAAGGDFDGDGTGDLFAGDDAGTVWLFLGPPSTGTEATADATFSTSGRTPIAFVGDTDGDGVDDALLGDPDGDGAAWFAGRAGWTGSYAIADGEVLFSAEAAGDGAGASVVGATDSDGDGRPEPFLGAPASDGSTGAAYLWFSGRWD